MHIDRFIELCHERFLQNNNAFPKSLWVECAGFESLYVRVGPRYIRGQRVQVIDLANMTASKPGNGAFKALVAHLRERYPSYGIHVENVMTERFRCGLVRMGFSPTNIPQCFFMPCTSS